MAKRKSRFVYVVYWEGEDPDNIGDPESVWSSEKGAKERVEALNKKEWEFGLTLSGWLYRQFELNKSDWNPDID